MNARDFTVQALLAGNTAAGTRVYPFPIPLKTALPAIAISLAAEDEQYTLSGASQYPLAVVQVHCVAASATGANNLGEAVKVYLRDLGFTFGDAAGSFMKSGPDFTDDDNEQTIFRRLITFDLRWR
jgi:hypothetical protein